MARSTGLVESKAQRWRALATYKDGTECLLYVGASFNQVTENYDGPFHDLLTEDERAQVKTIHLQKWHGAPDAGQWVNQKALPIPEAMVLNIGTRKAV